MLQVQVAKPHFIAKLGEEKALAAEEQAQQDRSLKRTEEVRLEKPITLVLANGQVNELQCTGSNLNLKAVELVCC